MNLTEREKELIVDGLELKREQMEDYMEIYRRTSEDTLAEHSSKLIFELEALIKKVSEE